MQDRRMGTSLVAIGIAIFMAAGCKPGEEEHPRAERTDLAAATTRAPFETPVGQPVVKAWLNGRGPYKLILDTGAGGTVLDSSLAAELGLKALGSTSLGDPRDPKKIKATTARLDSIRLGEAVFRGVQCAYWPNALPMRGPDAPRGVLSFPLFSDLLLTLDYPARSVELRRGELPPANGIDILPYQAPDSIPMVPIQVGGVRVLAHLDAGSSGGLAMPERYADSLRLEGPVSVVGRARSVNGEFEIRGAKLSGDFRLAGRVYRNPLVVFTPLPGANVGFRFLRGFAITFDQKNRTVRFEPDTSSGVAQETAQIPVQAPPPGGEPKRYGIGFAPDADPVTVLFIDPGSPADRAGLKVGDVLLAVDGRPFAGMNAEERLAALRRTPVTVRVRRGGEQIDIPMALDP